MPINVTAFRESKDFISIKDAYILFGRLIGGTVIPTEK